MVIIPEGEFYGNETELVTVIISLLVNEEGVNVAEVNEAVSVICNERNP